MRDDLDTSPFGRHEPTPFMRRVMRSTRRQGEGWLSRRFAYLLRRVAVRHLQGPVDTEAMGVNLRLYPFSNVCEKRILFTPQYFDTEERDLIASKVHDDFVFMDIGANIGGYALSVAAAAGPKSRIIAVEPQPEIFDRLVYNIGQNPTGTVKAVACAVADHDGEMTLFLNWENRGQASVKLMSDDVSATGLVKVPAKTLLSLAKEERLTHIDAAKLDVEGAEDLILEPFLRDAPRPLWPRLIVVGNVSSRWHRDIEETLVEHGYRKVLQTKLNMGFELEG